MKRDTIHGLALALLIGVLVATVAASAWMRRVAVPDWLGYLPREHEVFVVTGDLATLWRSVDDHFGAAIADTERDGWLAGLARALDEPFREAGVPIRDVQDLARHGFDVTRGAAWSFGLPGPAEPAVFLLFPVADRERMLDWFRALEGGRESATRSVVTSAGVVEALAFDDDAWIAFPEPGIAVLSDSPGLLERSLRGHDAAVHWWRNHDALVGAVAALHGPGGRAIVHWHHGAPPLRAATVEIAIGPRAVRVRATARLVRGGLQIVEDLLRDAASGSTSDVGPAEAAALLTVDDRALSRYLRFAGRFEGAARFMERSYGGILATLRDTAGLERVSVAMTGYRDGLPEIVLALDGDRAALDRAIVRQQARLAEQRDRRVLAGALDAWEARGDDGHATVDELERAGLLVSDPGLRDYTLVTAADGRVVVSGAPDRERFASEAYRADVGQAVVRYLAPRRNANDLRYLLGKAVAADMPIDTGAFLDDRFRVATVWAGDRLWIASDADALADLPDDRAPHESPIWQALIPPGAGGKLRGGVDVGRLIELGLLTPEPDVQGLVRHYLMDFSGFPAGRVELRTGPRAGTVSLELTLARGAAPGVPR